MFQSVSVDLATMTVGQLTDTRMTLVLHSPATANSTGIVLTEGYFTAEPGTTIEEVVRGADGTVRSQRTLPASGRYMFRPESSTEPGESISFTKTKA